jgi:hypothetical protein
MCHRLFVVPCIPPIPMSLTPSLSDSNLTFAFSTHSSSLLLPFLPLWPLLLLSPPSLLELDSPPRFSTMENTTTSSGTTLPRRKSTHLGTPTHLALPRTSTPSRPTKVTHPMPLADTPVNLSTRTPCVVMFPLPL